MAKMIPMIGTYSMNKRGRVERAGVQVQGRKLAGHCNHGTEDGVGGGIEAAVARCGDAVGFDIKHRLDVLDYDRIDRNMDYLGVGTCTSLLRRVGLQGHR